MQITMKIYLIQSLRATIPDQHIDISTNIPSDKMG